VRAFTITISSTSGEAQLTSFVKREHEPISCSFVGNPDLYGLGIKSIKFPDALHRRR
jgi:hypothetical protein